MKYRHFTKDRTSVSVDNQSGFTIVELMIASTVFMVVLLLCTYGLLQVGRTYSKGLVSTRTQERARAISETMMQNIQFGGSVRNLTGPGTNRGVCFGDKRFSWIEGRQRADGPPSGDQLTNVLIKDACPGAGTFTAQNVAGAPNVSEELISPRMRLERLRITPLDADETLYRVDVVVITGDNDMLEDVNSDGIRECRLNISDSAYCAVSRLTTIVKRRVNG